MDRISAWSSVKSGAGGSAGRIAATLQPPETPAEALRLSQRTAAECLAALGDPGLNPLQRIFRLDELSQSQIRRLALQLVGSPGGQRQEWLADWRIGRTYLDTLSCAYLEALRTRAPGGVSKSILHAELLARLIRAGSNLLKWDYLRYGPIERELWAFMGAAYREAERVGMLRMLVSLRKDRGTQTSVEREFVRAVSLGCASMDQLSPDAMEIADRLIRYVLPAVRISRQPGPGACFGLSVGAATPPRRLLGGEPAAGMSHYFLPGVLAPLLDELASVIEGGLVPAAIATGERARERVLSTLFHLRRHWSEIPPARRHRRHEVSIRLEGVRGLRGLSERLVGATSEQPGDYGWALCNVSRGGIGLSIPTEQCESLQVGELIGVRMEDGSGWHVGMVRRITLAAEDSGLVGVELIARAPAVVVVDDGRSATEVLLCDPVRQGKPVRLAGPASALHADAVVYLSLDGRVARLKPIASLVRGNEFVLRHYQLL